MRLILLMYERIQITAAEGINIETPDKNPTSSMTSKIIEVINPIESL